MVSRHIILFLLLVILPDLYIFIRYIRPRRMAVWKKLLWLCPGLFLIIFLVMMATARDFIPHNRIILYFFLIVFFL